MITVRVCPLWDGRDCRKVHSAFVWNSLEHEAGSDDPTRPGGAQNALRTRVGPPTSCSGFLGCSAPDASALWPPDQTSAVAASSALIRLQSPRSACAGGCVISSSQTQKALRRAPIALQKFVARTFFLVQTLRSLELKYFIIDTRWIHRT